MTEEIYTQTVEDLTTGTSDPNVRYIITNKKTTNTDGTTSYHFTTTEIRRDGKDEWRDKEGGIYAFSEVPPGDDQRIRCGAGFFSLSKDDPRNVGCAPHDFKYSSPVYQAYHLRSEADSDLERDLNSLGYPISGEVFHDIVDVAGTIYWEKKETNK